MRVKTTEIRDRIVEAAAALFSDMPYDDVSVKMITDRAGVSYSTFYSYFRTKEHIISAIVDFHITADQLMEITQGKSVIDQILAVTLYEVDAVIRVGPVTLHHQLNLSISQGCWSNIFNAEEYISILKRLVRAGQVSGEIANRAEPEILVAVMSSMVTGEESSWMVFRDDNVLRSNVEKYVRCILMTEQEK